MKKIFGPCAAAVLATAAPALASPDCSDVESAAKMPLWQIAQSFEEAGGQIDELKVTDAGCYEIYGREGESRVEIYYDPTTGEELEREER